MTRRLVLGYLLFALLVLLVLEIPLGLLAGRLERQGLVAAVRVDATTLALTAQGLLAESQAPRLRTLVEDYARYSGRGRVVVVGADGRVLADNAPLEPGSPDYSSRPEIGTALAGGSFTGFRFSRTLNTELLVVTVPLSVEGTTAGALRLSYPADVVGARVRRTWMALAALGVLVLLFAATLGYLLARGLSRPVRDLHQMAVRLAAGDTGARTAVPAGPAELHVLASQFNATAGKVEELLQGQRRFLADVSHQLRTPLAALRLRLDVLAPRVSDPFRADIEQAGAEAARFSRLVDGLLALARDEARDAPRERVDAASVTRERVDAWAALAHEGAVRLVADVCATAPVRAVPGALEQVLDNLLANAVAACEPGGSVQVEVHRLAAGVVLIVDDEGHGLTDEQLDAVARGDSPAGSSPRRADLSGSGLGLTIVRRLVTTSGGTFALSRRPERGTRAQVLLPSW